MKKFLPSLSYAALVLPLVLPLSLAGCALPPTTPDKTDPQQTITLTEAQSDTTIALFPGQRLEVRLPSNRTTGYRWAQTMPMHGVLRDASPNYETPPPLKDDNGRIVSQVGGGGTEVFVFTAAKPGEQPLKFEYSRTWESSGQAPAQQLSYNITVR